VVLKRFTPREWRIAFSWFLLVLFVTVVLNYAGYCQEKPEAGPPKLTELDSLKLETKVLTLQVIDLQLANLSLQHQRLTELRSAKLRDRAAFIDSLYRSLKIERADWDLDLETLQFVKREKKPVPKPE